jgi:hypothetical protein
MIPDKKRAASLACGLLVIALGMFLLSGKIIYVSDNGKKLDEIQTRLIITNQELADARKEIMLLRDTLELQIDSTRQ